MKNLTAPHRFRLRSRAQLLAKVAQIHRFLFPAVDYGADTSRAFPKSRRTIFIRHSAARREVGRNRLFIETKRNRPNLRSCLLCGNRATFFLCDEQGAALPKFVGGYCSRCAPSQLSEIEPLSIDEMSAPAPTLEELEKHYFGEIEFEFDAATLEAIESPTLAEEIAAINARAQVALSN